MPAEAQGDTVTARKLMREGRRRLSALDDQPAVQAQMMYVLGRTHRTLALYDEARRLLRRSLEQRQEIYGDPHPDVAQSMNELALFLRDQGQYAEADSLRTLQKEASSGQSEASISVVSTPMAQQRRTSTRSWPPSTVLQGSGKRPIVSNFSKRASASR
jgi:hypothetical protein